jgi:hypothetical protein
VARARACWILLALVTYERLAVVAAWDGHWHLRSASSRIRSCAHTGAGCSVYLEFFGSGVQLPDARLDGFLSLLVVFLHLEVLPEPLKLITFTASVSVVQPFLCGPLYRCVGWTPYVTRGCGHPRGGSASRQLEAPLHQGTLLLYFPFRLPICPCPFSPTPRAFHMSGITIHPNAGAFNHEFFHAVTALFPLPAPHPLDAIAILLSLDIGVKMFSPQSVWHFLILCAKACRPGDEYHGWRTIYDSDGGVGTPIVDLSKK